MQSPERSNENFLRYDEREPARKDEAGVALLDSLFNEVKGSSMSDISKIKPVMYHLDFDTYKKEATEFKNSFETYWHSITEKDTIEKS